MNERVNCIMIEDEDVTLEDLELLLLRALYKGKHTDKEDISNMLRVDKGALDFPHKVYELLIENADVNNSLRRDISNKLKITYPAKPTISTANSIISHIIASKSFKNKLNNLERKLDRDEINNVNNKLDLLKNILDRTNLHIDSSSDLVYSSEDDVRDPSELIARRKHMIEKLDNKKKKVNTYNNIIDAIINNRLSSELIKNTRDIEQAVKSDAQKLTIVYDKKLEQLLKDNASLKEDEKKELIDSLNKEKEEALQQLKASEYEKLNRLVAEAKHKAIRDKNNTQDDVVNTIAKSTEFQKIVKDSYYNNDYKLSDDELFHTLVSRGKTNAEAKELVKAIRLNSINMLMKDKKKIAALATIGRYDMSNLANMPEEVQQEINDAMIVKQREIDEKKNLKYKLPVRFIDYKNKQVIEQHVNPLLFRSAYSIKH